ncbi:hypothetical protein [Streptomyces sp. NPDC102437]|uniref:hypothetical protein n=1 Tax=Streptomyces sp. NPDC102437 TaxID=3366175 RepID=UPI00380E6A48
MDRAAVVGRVAVELQVKQSDIQVSVVLPESVRSESFKVDAPGQGAQPEVAAFNARLQARADSAGITPLEHARRCFEQIAEGRYWVFPQPEMVDSALPARTDMILGRHNPVLNRDV